MGAFSLDALESKSNSHYVRCVRGNMPTVTDRFTRDDTKDVVIDNETGLMWQDNDEVKSATGKDWSTAIEYCNNLGLGDYFDWYLPNINQLYYITDKGKSNPAMSSVFVNYSSSPYWSSTARTTSTPFNSIFVDFSSGGVESTAENKLCNVRCVRDNQ
jgi:hypothetical protein